MNGKKFIAVVIAGGVIGAATPLFSTSISFAGDEDATTTTSKTVENDGIDKTVTRKKTTTSDAEPAEGTVTKKKTVESDGEDKTTTTKKTITEE